MTPEQLEEIEARARAVTSDWRLQRRDGAPSGDSFNLGWDWVDDEKCPPEPMRGIFALESDAMFVQSAKADVLALTAALRQAWEENERLREALEWALDNAGTDHPHYPYREDDKWTYPYLISGTPLGGGVGNALFDTAAGAVRAALKEPTHDQD